MTKPRRKLRYKLGMAALTVALVIAVDVVFYLTLTGWWSGH